ncbi:MAG: LysR family transcriptional regulator [Bacteriovoracaceae bacterium]
MNLNEIAIFLKVVELGSFSAAAAALEMPKSTVSARISSLEKRLGATLIKRTTRKLHVSEIGKIYYQNCLSGITQIIQAEEKVFEKQTTPHGLLKMTAPVELGEFLLPSIIPIFNRAFPDVKLDITLTDSKLDLISEGIDIGIRVGTLKDSSLIAKKLGNIYFAPFAAAKYLKQYSFNQTPKELEKHQILNFSSINQNEWTLVSQKEKQIVKINPIFSINDLNLIKSLTISGLGISLLPTFICMPEVKSGKLIRILDKWKTEPRPVHFVYPSQKFVSPKTKAFIETTTSIIQSNLENAEL